MPELPEVEIVRQSLDKKIKQKKVKKVIVRNRNLRKKVPLKFEKYNNLYDFWKNKIEAIENKTEGNKFAEKKCREMIANIEAFFNEVDYHTQVTFD